MFRKLKSIEVPYSFLAYLTTCQINLLNILQLKLGWLRWPSMNTIYSIHTDIVNPALSKTGYISANQVQPIWWIVQSEGSLRWPGLVHCFYLYVWKGQSYIFCTTGGNSSRISGRFTNRLNTVCTPKKLFNSIILEYTQN